MTRIAVIGMACRYPDATSPRELWESAIAGRRAFRRLPDARMRLDDYWDGDPTVPDKFYGGSSAAPLLADAAARLECAQWHTYDGGDHSIFIGRLLSFERVPDADVLLFLHGRFGRLQREAAVDLTT
nr:flavin reductase family protein [Salinispora oceanensis]